MNGTELAYLCGMVGVLAGLVLAIVVVRVAVRINGTSDG